MMLQTPIAAQQSSMSSKRTKATTSARIQIASSPHMLNAEAQPFSTGEEQRIHSQRNQSFPSSSKQPFAPNLSKSTSSKTT